MKKKMILIDASGLLFRAYFAMMKNPLRTKDGQATSAVFGFLRSVFNLVKKYPSHAIVAAFDVPRSTLERTQSYTEYKATRKATPDELIKQIPIAKEALIKAGIPALTVAGHEADDVLASLVKKYKNKCEIIIFTGDKDLLQLVEEGVEVALPDKKQKDGIILLDSKGVKEYKGVYPREIPDFLAILGDTSDNIPGIKGIGEKGALALIQEFHNIENIYNNLDNIKPSLVKKLNESKEKGFLSLDLIRLREDLMIDDVVLSENFLTLSQLITEEFVYMLQNLELFSLIKELSQNTGASNKNFNDELSLFSKKEHSQEEFSLITCDQLNKGKISLMLSENEILFSSEEKIFSLSKDKIEEFSPLLKLFFEGLCEDEKRIFVYDWKSLVKIFYQQNWEIPLIHDIKLMAYLLDPARNAYGLSYLSQSYLGKNDNSVLVLPELADILLKNLSDQEMLSLYEEIDLPLRSLLSQLEDKGVRLDCELLNKLSENLGTELSEIEQKIYTITGKEFNILSPKQLGQVLFDDIGLTPYKKTKTKNYSTDEETLEYLSHIHPLPAEVLKYRSLSKFKSTYTDALPKLTDEHSRVHTTLHQTVTATGRLSSGEPNLQNIPIRTKLGKEIRQSFIPSDDKLFLSADYSQIELRLFAHLSKDPSMKKFFLSGGDIHRYTAAAILGIKESVITDDQRRAAKTINYGISYGMSAFRLANELSIEFGEAKDFIDRYFETFAGVKKFMQSTLEFASQYGYVTTMYGRRRLCPELLGKTPDKLTNLSHASRFAINAVLQGSAADIIKKAMLSVESMIQEKYLGKCTMILQVHDELLFEIDAHLKDQFSQDLTMAMEDVAVLEVPLEISLGVGNNWSEAH